MKSLRQDDALQGDRCVGCVKWMCSVPGGGSGSSSERRVLGLAEVWGSRCRSGRPETPMHGGK